MQKTKTIPKTKQKNVGKKNTSYKRSNIFRKGSLRFPLKEESDSPNLKEILKYLFEK